MPDNDERFSIIKGLLLHHVSLPSERQVRDGLAVYMLTREIIERLDHRTGIWRKWNEERESLLKSAAKCWIPIGDMRAYLNEMPGPELTQMDVAQRMRAFHEGEAYEHYPSEDLKPGCLEIYEREMAEGTELPAIIGAIREWLEEEESRRWREHDAARKQRIEAEKSALEQRLRSGADCSWTPLNKSEALYSRKNGRTFRLSPTPAKRLELHRIQTLEDEKGKLIGTYGTRSEAGKVLNALAYEPEPRW